MKSGKGQLVRGDWYLPGFTCVIQKAEIPGFGRLIGRPFGHWISSMPFESGTSSGHPNEASPAFLLPCCFTCWLTFDHRQVPGPWRNSQVETVERMKMGSRVSAPHLLRLGSVNRTTEQRSGPGLHRLDLRSCRHRGQHRPEPDDKQRVARNGSLSHTPDVVRSESG